MKAAVTEINVTPLRTDGNFYHRLIQPKLWRLNNDVTVTLAKAQWVIPAGMVFDFASVPRFLKPFFPDDALYSGAALVHDDAYTRAPVSKWMADALLAELLAQDGMKWTGLAMWLAVALFGHGAWKAHRAKDPKQVDVIKSDNTGSFEKISDLPRSR